jgi:hypothetical protein
MINWQYLLDNTFALGVIVAWACAMALYLIYRWEDKRG